MTKCPDCDGPLEYNEALGTYYCPKCEKHWEPIEAEQKKTMYQDTTFGNEAQDNNESEEETEELENE